jgi:hypothetical protein
MSPPACAKAASPVAKVSDADRDARPRLLVSDRHRVTDAELSSTSMRNPRGSPSDSRAEAERKPTNAPDRERPHVDAEDRHRSQSPKTAPRATVLAVTVPSVPPLLERSFAWPSGVPPAEHHELRHRPFSAPRNHDHERDDDRERICSGLSTSQLAVLASASLGVLSQTHRHAAPGSSPHALVRSATSSDVTQDVRAQVATVARWPPTTTHRAKHRTK